MFVRTVGMLVYVDKSGVRPHIGAFQTESVAVTGILTHNVCHNDTQLIQRRFLTTVIMNVGLVN
jgi:hypothetical protein